MSYTPFTEDDIEVDEATLREIGERYLRAIQQNVKEGMNAEGKPLPRGVDLYRSGNLLYRDVSVTVNPPRAGVTVDFNADYAKKVDDRFNFIGLPPAKREQFLEELASLGSGVHTKGKP